MSTIAQKLFAENKSKLLGDSTLSDYLNDNFLMEEVDHSTANAIFVILNPDHPQYEDQLDNMEQAYSGHSLHGLDTNAGFNPEGEVSRILVFPESVDVGSSEVEMMQTNDPSFIKKVLPDILYDSYLINQSLGILEC